MIQIGSRNEYRARVWEFDGKWWVAIETPNAVGGWREVSLGVGGSWWEETYSIYHLSFTDEASARREANRLLEVHREVHARHDAPRLAAEAAEILE